MKTFRILTITLLLTTFTVGTFYEASGQSESNDLLADNLIEAVANIDQVSVNVLLAEGASVETVDQNGNTPLMIAAKVGNPRIVKMILAHNPDVNRKNNEGNSALMIAAEHGQVFVAEQLLANGADRYAKNSNGFTPLEIAKRNGHAAVIDLLRNKPEMSLSR